MEYRVLAQLTLFTGIIGLAFPAQAGPDPRETYVHFILTQAQQVRRDLDLARSGLQRALRAEVEKRNAEDLMLFETRWELVPALTNEAEQAHLMGTVAIETPLYRSGGFEHQWYGGTSFYDISGVVGTRRQSLATFGNFLAGGEVRYDPWISMHSNISFNIFALPQTRPGDGSHWMLDQVTALVRSPFLKLFGISEYDLARGEPRDAQFGFHWVFDDRAWGEITASIDHRFDYQVKGLIFQGDGLADQTLKGDTTGIFRWENTYPSGDFGLSMGVALGDIKSILRYAFLEARLGGSVYRDVGYLFVRAGAAHNRWNEEILPGWGVGIAMNVGSQNTLFRINFGRNDPEVVDRIGDTGGFMGSLMFGMGW